MHFTDTIFLFYFMPLVLLAHRLLVNGKANGKPYPIGARLLIFVTTLVFYGLKQPWWLAPFLLCIGFDFLWAALISQTERPGLRKFWLAMSVVQNLSILSAFKYWGFFVRIGERAFPSMQGGFPEFNYGAEPILLPAGISFYTFESLSFVIDVYRRETKPPKSPLEFLSFIAMFPRFVAGPIVRYKDLVGQIHCYQGMKIEKGLTTFILGLFLKVCFADQFAIFTPYAFGQSGAIDFISAWLGTLAYTFQIYFDFSGYSLMAIGLGQALGFEFPANFDRPYLSSSITEFWRRWHISLSFWLRDYVYISLGGNRKGRLRTYFNLMATMALGGLWHGAGVTFILWGVWHGAWLCIEKARGGAVTRFKAVNSVFCFLIVHLGWVVFRADHLHQIRAVFAGLLGMNPDLQFNSITVAANPYSVGMCLLGIVYVFGIERKEKWTLTIPQVPWSIRRLAYSLMMAMTALLTLFSAGRTIPFLYFQF